MQKLLVAISVGIGAGIIDVIPMFIQKIDRNSCVAAFVHWLVLGVVIAYVSAPVPDWAKGALVGFFGALSTVILVAQGDPKSAVPILVTSTVLGSVVGMLAGKFAL